VVKLLFCQISHFFRGNLSASRLAKHKPEEQTTNNHAFEKGNPASGIIANAQSGAERVQQISVPC
jgi:hypothetical protein